MASGALSYKGRLFILYLRHSPRYRAAARGIEAGLPRRNFVEGREGGGRDHSEKKGSCGSEKEKSCGIGGAEESRVSPWHDRES